MNCDILINIYLNNKSYELKKYVCTKINKCKFPMIKNTDLRFLNMMH